MMSKSISIVFVKLILVSGAYKIQQYHTIFSFFFCFVTVFLMVGALFCSQMNDEKHIFIKIIRIIHVRMHSNEKSNHNGIQKWWVSEWNRTNKREREGERVCKAYAVKRKTLWHIGEKAKKRVPKSINEIIRWIEMGAQLGVTGNG